MIRPDPFPNPDRFSRRCGESLRGPEYAESFYPDAKPNILATLGRFAALVFAFWFGVSLLLGR